MLSRQDFDYIMHRNSLAETKRKKIQAFAEDFRLYLSMEESSELFDLYMAVGNAQISALETKNKFRIDRAISKVDSAVYWYKSAVEELCHRALKRFYSEKTIDAVKKVSNCTSFLVDEDVLEDLLDRGVLWKQENGMLRVDTRPWQAVFGVKCYA